MNTIECVNTMSEVQKFERGGSAKQKYSYGNFSLSSRSKVAHRVRNEICNKDARDSTFV